MTETGTTTGAGNGVLNLVLPPLWQRIHVGRGLEAMLDIASSEEYERELGPDTAAQTCEALSSLRAACAADGIVFAALRMRTDQQAIDVLTVALPQEDGSAAEPERPRRTRTGNGGGTAVDLGGVAGISHSSLTEPSSSGEPFFRAHVQIVTRVRPEGRGAIVTLASSAPDARSLLESDAEEIAGSLRIESVGPSQPSGREG